MQLALGLVLWLLAGAVQAQDICLWQVEGGKSRVYLLGSVHVYKASGYPLPGPMEAAYRAADTLVLEVDMNSVAPGTVSRLLQDRGQYKGNDSLANHLSEPTRVLLDDYLAKHHMSPADVAGVKPWLLALRIQMRELSDEGYAAGSGIDEYFARQAAKDGKPVRQLETFESQIDLLALDTPQIQDLALRATLEDLDQSGEQVAQLMAAWREGDIDRMYAFATQSASRYPLLAGQLQRLVVARNHRMADKIRRWLGAGGTWLVVAGALHMGGPQGIVKLLGQEYKVTQLQTGSSITEADH